ncbi:MAG: VOC family protein [Acidobacteria bacterium]|nr:VOC family protein [Acidobacteriota bacterium]
MNELEPSVDFWTNRIGFQLTASVPHEDKLGFVILVNEGAELMLQSRASAAGDIRSLDEFHASSRAALFIEVSEFDAVAKRLEGYPIAMPTRETFYGMKEVGVFEPGGNFIVFACSVQK